MPRYKFRWSNLPKSLIDNLCDHLYVDSGGPASAEVLQVTYGARPKANFLAGAWKPLRERQLTAADQIYQPAQTNHTTSRR